VIDLLSPISPPRPVAPKEQPLPLLPEEPRWYLDRRYQVGIGAVVVAAVITTIVLTTGGTNMMKPSDQPSVFK